MYSECILIPSITDMRACRVELDTHKAILVDIQQGELLAGDVRNLQHTANVTFHSLAKSNSATRRSST